MLPTNCRGGSFQLALLIGVVACLGVGMMPGETGPWALVSGAGAGGLSWMLFRWGNRRARAILLGCLKGASLGVLLAGALLFHPYWSEDETRPQDGILAGLIICGGIIGGVAAALIAKRELDDH